MTVLKRAGKATARLSTQVVVPTASRVRPRRGLGLIQTAGWATMAPSRTGGIRFIFFPHRGAGAPAAGQGSESCRMTTDRIYQHVHVGPIRLLQESLALMGSDYWMFLALTFVGMIIGSIVPLVVYGPMVCGIYLCYLRRMQGKKADFETLFQGFDYFVESLIATLLISLVTIVVIVPCGLVFMALLIGAAVSGSDAHGVTLAVLLLLLPLMILVSLVMTSLFLFVYPLIVDRGYAAVPAIKASCRAVWANLGGIVLLMVVYGVLSMVAALACGIGTLFFTPVLFGALTIVYRQIFPPQRPPLANAVN
jgi:uncharacterized membrane protein